jgi:hypothetical protein
MTRAVFATCIAGVTDKCPNKILYLKRLWLKIFSICHQGQWHWWFTLSCENLREFSEKFETTALLGYSELGGNCFMKKIRSRKSRGAVPFGYCRGQCEWVVSESYQNYLMGVVRNQLWTSEGGEGPKNALGVTENFYVWQRWCTVRSISTVAEFMNVQFLGIILRVLILEVSIWIS